MGIQFFLDKTVQIRRASTLQGFKLGYSATASVEMHIQSLSDEKTSLIQGVFGRTYVAWIALEQPVDVQEGDRVRDADGRDFEVKTINRRDFGSNQHQEIILERLDNQDNK